MRLGLAFALSFSLVLLVVSGSSSMTAQVLVDLNEAEVREAIAEGLKDEKASRWSRPRELAPAAYVLTGNSACSAAVSVTTPFSRIVAAARHAKRHYKPFVVADISESMRAPELEVLAAPARVGADVHDAETVVIARRGAREISSVVHPTNVTEFDTQYQNLMGAKFDGKGVVARFPLSVVSKDHEIRVVRRGYAECRHRLDPRALK